MINSGIYEIMTRSGIASSVICSGIFDTVIRSGNQISCLAVYYQIPCFAMGYQIIAVEYLKYLLECDHTMALSGVLITPSFMSHCISNTMIRIGLSIRCVLLFTCVCPEKSSIIRGGFLK